MKYNILLLPSSTSWQVSLILLRQKLISIPHCVKQKNHINSKNKRQNTKRWQQEGAHVIHTLPQLRFVPTGIYNRGSNWAESAAGGHVVLMTGEGAKGLHSQ